MRLTVFAGAVLLLAALSHAESDKASDWSWGADKDDKKKEADAPIVLLEESTELNGTKEITGRSLGGAEGRSLGGGGGEHVIDDILVSNRQGRNLDGFDDVYSDPHVQRALQSGNDSQARQYIKERLCNLGLMACDDIEIDAKSPSGYINPQEVFYAQPVAIKPVGHPIPAVPVRSQHALRPPFEGVRPGYDGPRPGYDGPRPGSYDGPRPGSYDGPRPGGYDGPRPGFDGPRPGFDTVRQGYNGPRPGAGFNSGPFISSRPVPGPIYGAAKPVAPVYEVPLEPELNYGSNSKLAQVNTNGQGLQQHVHHHFHHGESNVKPVIVGGSTTGAVYGGLGGHGVLGQGGLGGVNSHSHSQGGFGGVNSHGQGGFGGVNSHGQGGYTVLGGGNNYGAVNSLGSAGVYGSQSIGPGAPFYKKELNIRPSTSISGNSLNPSYAGSFPSYESPRADSDCVCVPYDQCASFERKNGGQQSLIDPRNVPDKNIEAISLDDVVITDGNGTIISHHKKREDNAEEEVKEEVNDEVKETRRKRDADDDDKSKVEARYKLGLGNGGQNGGYGSDLRIKPTFGVSFGLPQGGGGYPLNPFGTYPALNPYGGSIGGLGGVSLGPVSVNPLLSVQVTKNDDGEKVIKPLVNLHVTPNHGIIHKIGSFFHGLHAIKHKPHYGYGYGGGHQPFYNKHHHQHHHVHHAPHHHGPHHHGPHHHGPPHHGPPPHGQIIEGPIFEGPHPPHFHNEPPPFLRPRPPQFRPHSPYPYNDYYGYRTKDEIPHESNVGNSYPSVQSQGGFSPYIGDDEDNNNNYNDNNFNNNNGPYSDFRNARILNTSATQGRVQFPTNRRTIRDTSNEIVEERQAGGRCGPRHVCCRRNAINVNHLQQTSNVNNAQCGKRHAQGINGRIKNPVYVDGDSEFGEYPWQAAILKKDAQESVYVCGGTLIDNLHVITAAHCIKTYQGGDLRVRLGEWDVNHDVEFYPYEERDVAAVHIHPDFYAGTLLNDLAILRLARPVDTQRAPHISAACLPDPRTDYSGQRCWTTGWGKDAFGDYGKYQNILKEVDVPVVSHHQCQSQLQQTRLGYEYRLNPGMICAGGEEGKDACKGDGGGPMVCEYGGTWQVVGVVSWGIGCGQYGVPGVYVKVAHYVDWIRQITRAY